MLKKSSRPVSTKKSLMVESFSLLSPTSKTSTLFPLSPRAFVGFPPKGYSDNIDAAMSPTSIFETKTNPFFSKKNPRKPFIEQTQVMNNHQPVGLGIVDELKKPSKPESRMVLFGSQLKIQIPRIGLVEDPQSSPIEFGIKNRESQLALLSPAQRTPMVSSNLVYGCISVSEVEMSEEYTCVIAHGPNPKTTHIFDNCIVECCGDGFVAVTPKKENGVVADFLASCDACKKKLGEGKDIFIYRGEKAFCSRECRHKEMLFDGNMEDCLLTERAVTTL